LRKLELQTRRHAVELFVQLGNDWNELAETLTARSKLALGVAFLLQQVEPEVRERWEAETGFAVQPVPTTFPAFIDELLEAATGDRPDVEAKRAHVEAENARRRTLAKTDPGGGDDLPLLPPPTIAEKPVHKLVPDLRGRLVTADVIGAPIRQHGSRTPEVGRFGGTAA
jgi:hypothetical protein